MSTTREAGTVKVGRWFYPAVRDNDGTVMRNEKRDATGTWEETNPALFTTIGSGDPATEKTAQAHLESIEAEEKAAAKVASGSAKTTWQVGDTCPKGLHTLTDEDGDNPVYVMPSGRKQCRMCRRGYASNQSTGK